jgi:glycerol-3-phosphate O-acyltransferase
MPDSGSGLVQKVVQRFHYQHEVQASEAAAKQVFTRLRYVLVTLS